MVRRSDGARPAQWGGSVDPDVDLHDPQQRGELGAGRWRVLAAIAAGGVLGAEARAALASGADALDGYPVRTVLINVVGSILIGVLMATITGRPGVHRLVRPFLGVGVLGGFTTFSAYTVDVVRLLDAGHAAPALVTLVITPLAALAAVWVGATATARTLRGRS